MILPREKVTLRPNNQNRFLGRQRILCPLSLKTMNSLHRKRTLISNEEVSFGIVRQLPVKVALLI